MATANDTSRNIPGLDDLLANTFTFRDPERAQKAAFNCGYPITRGIAAIGDLLWAASQDKDNQLDATTIGDIGCLLKHLAEFDEAVRRIGANAAYQISEARAKYESESVEIPVIGEAS